MFSTISSVNLLIPSASFMKPGVLKSKEPSLCESVSELKHGETHTYFRKQDFSIMPVSCSLVHQPDANYSSNLQERKTTKSLFNFVSV